MNKTEIIFIIAIILVYIICSLTLNIQSEIHIIFAALLLVVLLIAIIFKYQQKFENEKMIQYMNILEIIIAVCFIVTLIYELFIGKAAYDLSIFIILFFIVMFCKWFFGKK